MVELVMDHRVDGKRRTSSRHTRFPFSIGGRAFDEIKIVSPHWGPRVIVIGEKDGRLYITENNYKRVCVNNRAIHACPFALFERDILSFEQPITVMVGDYEQEQVLVFEIVSIISSSNISTLIPKSAV